MAYKECMKSELDIFDTPPIQTAILRSDEISYQPLASLDNPSVIEFLSVGNGDCYRDLSSIQIRFKIQLLNSNGEKFKNSDENQPSVANNILHSIIRSCSLSLNGTTISQNEGDYHYRSYIETILSYGTDATNTFLQNSGWYRDDGEMDSLTGNSGLEKRKELFKNSKVVEVMGRLHCDLINQPVFLINNVDLRVILTLEKSAFFIIENASDNSMYKVLEATMYIKQLTINPNILMAHNAVLTKRNAVYHYKKVEIKTVTISSGSNSINLDNIIHGILPRRIIFGMVENAAYNGTKSLNPYNFQHFNMTDFILLVNGIPYPTQPLQMNFEDDHYARAYQTLFNGTGIHHDFRSHQIKKEDFKKGFFLLAFDLDPDSYTDSCLSLLEQGTVRIEGRFARALSKTITCIVYAEYDTKLEIDKNRNIILS